MDRELLQQGAELILKGLDPVWREKPNLKESHYRMMRAYEELADYDPQLIDSELASVFPVKDDPGMVTLTNIEAVGLCPHHLLPVEYIVHVGYVPRKSAVGLSKLARVAVSMCKQLEIQEQITQDMAALLEDRLEPRGVIVVIRGRHGCMRFRGVKQENSWAVTSAVRGVFRDPKEQARSEFLALVADGGGRK